MNKNKGFTLTEVLLAVAIVGIIAALVLPMVVKNYQEKTLDAALNREKQTLDASVKALLINENTDAYEKTMLYTYEAKPTSYENTSGKFIKKYLKVSKYCGDSNGDCFASKYYKYENGDKVVHTPTYKGACASLKNGSSICIQPQTSSEIVKILLDVNGKKGPNVLGRDLREYEISLPKKAGLDRSSSDIDWDYKLVKIEEPTTPETPDPPEPSETCSKTAGTDAACCMKSSEYAVWHERSCCGNIKEYFDLHQTTCCSKWGSNPWCPSSPPKQKASIQLTLEYDRQGSYNSSNPFHGVIIKTSTVNAPSYITIQCNATCSLSSSASSSRWMVSTVDGYKKFPMVAQQVGPSCRISAYAGQQPCGAPNCIGYETRDYTQISGYCQVYASAGIPSCRVTIPNGTSNKSDKCRIDFDI